MKKILTAAEKEKKETRNKTIIGVILAGLMLLSVAGYSLLSGEKEETAKTFIYNGKEFYETSSGWATIINENYFYFQYSPFEVEEINFSLDIYAEDYSGKAVFLDSIYSDANYEIAQNLKNYYERINLACLSEENCSEDLPIKNCNDSVISIKETNFTTITREENCVFITAKEGESLKVVDAFLYKIFGIKN